MTNDDDVDFFVTTGFGHRAQKPFVSIAVGAKDFHVQMSPEDATSLAHNILAAAESALQDAFLISFLRKRVGTGDREIAAVLIDFREWRKKRVRQP